MGEISGKGNGNPRHKRHTRTCIKGLGSSSTAVVAGLMATNAMLGSPLTKKELVTEATLIEGHPDNVAPAILGGITINIMADDKVKSLRFLPACPLGMIVLVPALHVSTEEARKVLPKEIPHKDAVYSASRGYARRLTHYRTL